MSRNWVPKFREIGQTFSAYLLLAKELCKHGQYAQALLEIEQALVLNPEMAEAYHVKGIIQTRLGRLEEAYATVSTALRYKSDFPKAWISLSLLAMERYDYPDALASIDQALRYDGKNANAHLIKGNILQALDCPEEAAKAFQSALELNPALIMARYKLATALLKLGKECDAEQQVVKALQFNPMDAQNRILLGDILFARGKLEAAGKEYMAAVKLHTRDSAVAQGKVGATWLELGWVTEAINALQLALKMDARQYRVYVNLARAYVMAEQFDDAKSMLMLAIEMDGSNPEAVEFYNSLIADGK